MLLLTLSGFAYGQQGKLTVHIEFRGIEDGYDYMTKDELYVDDQLLQVTDEHMESQAIDVQINVPLGKHKLSVVNWTLYEGSWEKTTIENEYSIDGFGEIQCNFKKKGKVSIVYDLDDQNSPLMNCK